MSEPDRPRPSSPVDAHQHRDEREGRAARPACPACGGPLVEIKAKLVCSRCRAICETCCEGGPG